MSYARMQLLKIGKKKVKVSFYLSVKQEWVVLHGFFFVFLQNKNELFFIRFEHYSDYASSFHSRKLLFFIQYNIAKIAK